MSARRPLLGMTAEPEDTALMVSTFPDILYMRQFGASVGTQKGVRLRLPGEGKWPHLPEHAIMHDSWKGGMGQLPPYLDLLTRPVLLSPWHEPMGNVAPADFRALGEEGAEIIRAHPNGHLVLGWGPILTRWWLEHGGNPDDFWFNGATFFAADTYLPDGATFYWTAERMLGTIASTAARYGVPWLVPELGYRLLGDDSAGRAAALRDCAEWADREGNCLAIGEWGIGGNRLIGYPVETATWRELTAAQKGYTMADWRVARGLDRLLAQINAMAPNRGKASDGSIGDAEHRNRPSDHNPDAQGVVRARDFTHDPAAGANMGEISEALRVSRDRRIKYVIFNRRIFSGAAGPSPYTWRTYTGTNPHTHHMHVSTVADNTIADDVSEWEIGEDVATTEDAKLIAKWTLGREPGVVRDEVWGRSLSGSVDAMITYLQQLLAKAAEDETRDVAHAAALQALGDLIRAGGGDVDTAAILAHIDAAAAGTNTAVEAMRAAHQAELDGLRAELDAARLQLVALPDAVVDEQAGRLAE